MRTINVGGKEYVLKSDVDEELKKATKQKFKILAGDSLLTDEPDILGVGTFQLGGDQVVTRLSTEYLEKIIKCLKIMSFNKEGLETIDLAWAKDFPAIIGKRNNKGLISGFIIAPRNEM